MLKTIFRPLAFAALALVVASCTSNKKIEYCPGVSSLLDAYMASTFTPGTKPEPANALYTVEILNVKGDCSFDKKGKTSDSSIEVMFGATRAVAGAAAQYSVPYFVAVTQANRVVTKTLRTATFSFADGEKTASFEDDVSSVSLVTDGDLKPYDYQVLVGLQLSKEQLEYNRSVGIFAR